MSEVVALIVTPAENIPGRKVTKTLGLVRGNTIRARHLGKDIVAAFKAIVGGEIEEYTKLMGEAREQALSRMVAEARERGANAITTVRFTTSSVMGGACEILAFGNAVIVQEVQEVQQS